MRRIQLAVMSVAVSMACIGQVGPGELRRDAGAGEAADGGSLDGGLDAGAPDSGEVDAGSSDSSVADAGDVFDAGPRPDSGWFDRDAGWGAGTDVGTFSNGVWTPGRDSSGNVNAASWATTPVGTWFEVADSRLDSLDAVVKAAIPGWRDYGTEGWDGVTNDWNGLTIDASGNRVWLTAAGGHSGSSNNGIYQFNGFKMAWGVELLPSDPSAWSASYRGLGAAGGTFSACAESVAAQQSKQDAGTWSPIDDFWFDELFWDHAPTSRHTYSAHAFIPASNELVMSCRGQRLWRYSLTSKRWTSRRVLEDGARTYDGAGTYAFYDEVRGEYLHGGATDGVYTSIGYRLSDAQWIPWGSPWSIYVVADARHGRDVTVMANINSTGAYAGQYWRYNLDSRSVTAGGNGATVQFAGGLSRADFSRETWYYDGAGLCFVPPLNEYWYWERMATGAMQLLKIDPTTTPWSISPKVTTGRVPQPHVNHMRKTVWMPVLNAVMLVDQAGKNVAFYRF